MSRSDPSRRPTPATDPVATGGPADPAADESPDKAKVKVGSVVSVLLASGPVDAVVEGVHCGGELRVRYVDPEFPDRTEERNVNHGRGFVGCWCSNAEHHREACRQTDLVEQARRDGIFVPSPGDRVMFWKDVDPRPYNSLFKSFPGVVAKHLGPQHDAVALVLDEGKVRVEARRASLYEGEPYSQGWTREGEVTRQPVPRGSVEIETWSRNLRCTRCDSLIPAGHAGGPIAMPGGRLGQFIPAQLCPVCLPEVAADMTRAITVKAKATA